MTGDDYMRGGAGGDSLYGGAGADTVQGEEGVDQLTGGAGLDTFAYGTLGASTPALYDTIADFSRTDGDLIGLRPIDANPTVAGDQTFSFVSTAGAAFTGGGVASVRWYQSAGNTFVEADTGDGVADLTVRLMGTINLQGSDFQL